GGAEREADNAEHQAGDRNRELPVDGHDLVVRRRARLLELRRALPQLGDGHLGIAFGWPASWKDDVRIDGDDLPRELDHLIRTVRVRRVARAVLEDHLDGALLRVEHDAPVPDEIDRL